MRDEQRIIADWMHDRMAEHGLTGEQWADRADVSPTTVTRALKDDYTSVTSIPTLHALARGIGEVSVLDHLESASGTMFSEEALQVILSEILRPVAPKRLEESQLRLLAGGLARGLELLARNPAIRSNADALREVVRSAAALPRAATPEA